MAADGSFPWLGAHNPWRRAMSKHWGETWDENHPHSELTGTIIAAAIRVQKALGPGLLEDACKACLAHALHQEGLKALREVRLDITWEWLWLPNAYLMDLLVEDKVAARCGYVRTEPPSLQDASCSPMIGYEPPYSKFTNRP
jgi:hypothetical protein